MAGPLQAAAPLVRRRHHLHGIGGYGTVNFTSLPAVDIGLELHHASGVPLVTLYGPAARRRISLRTPGDLTYDEFRRCIDGRSTGAVRVSLGIVSTAGDVSALLGFLRSFLD